LYIVELMFLSLLCNNITAVIIVTFGIHV